MYSLMKTNQCLYLLSQNNSNLPVWQWWATTMGQRATISGPQGATQATGTLTGGPPMEMWVSRLLVARGTPSPPVVTFIVSSRFFTKAFIHVLVPHYLVLVIT